MHEYTSIIMNYHQLFQQILFNKSFVVEGEKGVLKERLKTNRWRGGVKLISIVTLWKIVWFFKQQIQLLLISCLEVAKSLIKKV